MNGARPDSPAPRLRPLVDRTVVAVLEEAVAAGPGRIAIRDPSGAFTYEEIWTRGARFAGGLRSIGVGPADPVLLMLGNHVDFVTAYLGVTFTGAIEVPVNTAYQGAMLAHVVNDSCAKILLIEDSYLPKIEAIADQLASLMTVVIRSSQPAGAGRQSETESSQERWQTVSFAQLAAHDGVEPVRPRPSDVLAIMYTSGTTGPSKGVLLPHAHAYTVGASRPFGGGWLDTDRDDVNYVFLPLYHQAGQWGGVLNAFIAGASAYLAPKFSASTFWDDVRRVGATTAGFVGSAGAMLLAQPPQDDDSDNPMREISMAPLVREVAEFERRFAVKVTTSFGSTEIGCVLVDDDPALRRGTYRPRSGYAVRIVDDQDIEVPAGEAGELIIRPPEPWTSLIGYHNQPEKSLNMWRNGWLHTGDALRAVGDGSFEFVDRIKDCIRRRGENISSLEVEAEVLAHPQVRECAAYPVPSELGEDEVMVAVIVEPPLEAEALGAYLDERMPKFMQPRFIRIVEDLPKTPTAKVRKAELKRQGRHGAWDRNAAAALGSHLSSKEQSDESS